MAKVCLPRGPKLAHWMSVPRTMCRPFLGGLRYLNPWKPPQLHAFWAGQALHSHYFGQSSRQRFGRRGRTKG